MAPIDFWFSIGSTYSYLSVMRMPEVVRASGADVRNIEGMVFDPVTGDFKRSTRDLDVNYFMTAFKTA